MLNPFLTASLSRLDRWLIKVCDAEEKRAALLAGDGTGGWEGVRNLARPTVDELVWLEEGEPDLIPAGSHPLAQIATALNLSACEAEALIVVLAPHLEARYSSLYAVLHDDLEQPQCTERTVLTVLGRSPVRRRMLIESLRPGGRLIASGLLEIQPGRWSPQRAPLTLPRDVRDALLGVARPSITGALEVISARGSGDMSDAAGVIHGPGDRRRAVEKLLPGPLVHVRLPPALPTAVLTMRAAWRVGLATGTYPVVNLDGLETRDCRVIGRLAEGLVRDMGGRLCLSSREPVPVALPHWHAVSSGWEERRVVWMEALQTKGTPELELAGRLATHHRLEPDEVRAAVRASTSLDEPDLHTAARSVGQRAVHHGQRVATTRSFSDLVLRPTTLESLERLVYYVENRDRIGELRGLERRYRLQHGPIAMFSGRSGTGKTLAAEVLAGILGRPLHVVDLSRLVSKYIGETETHIDEALSSGERAGAVLFFDEADAMFSNRTDVSSSNDRFANLEVGYLLQRIERHDGLVILATNLRQSIDEAFLRRFQFRIEFPFPEPTDRARIWELMLPPSVPRDGDLDLERLARQHKLAGGNIRNAALKAIFLAEQREAPLTQAHLDEAVAIELLELGRLSRRAHGPPDRGALLRGYAEQLGDGIEDVVRDRFLKEIYILHGSPTKEALAGKRPAVSVVLYRLAARRGGTGIRVGFIVSVWSQRAEEEHELLGVVHEALMGMNITDVLGRTTTMRVQESYDFDLLHRFWSSHEQPVRASIVVDGEIN